MSSKQSQSRRRKRRSGSAPMPAGGAGLMRFFEDSSIGVKVGPIATIIMSAVLIVVIILAHLEVFAWLFGLGGT